MLSTRKLVLLPLLRLMGIVLAAVALTLGFAGSGLSHPHVFLETEMQIELDSRGIKGLWQEWIFDEYQSAWIINQYDTDRSGEISGPELDRLYRETFDNLKNYDFFTWVVTGSQKIPARKIEHFSVRIKDGLAVYSFFVPFDIEIGPGKEEVFILVYDETYFCHVFFPPEEIEFKGETASWDIEYSFRKKSDMTFYFGMVTPEAIHLKLTPL